MPPGSAAIIRQFPRHDDFDEAIHCLRCVKPGTGTKDAPRAFSLKLRKTTTNSGLKGTSFEPEFEVCDNLRTAKHVDDKNLTVTEVKLEEYVVIVEGEFGQCKVNKHEFTCVGVRHKKETNTGDVVLDQDEYIKIMRPIVSPELTGAPPEKQATKGVADQFVSLRGALAYTTLTQAWLQVYIVALQRVQEPTNLDVRRLNAIVRRLQRDPQKLIFPAMRCSGKIDLHSDSGYRRQTGDADDEIKGYGIRGMNVLRKGITKDGKPVVHLLESLCKSHRLQVRSSYGAEMLAAAHGLDEAYPTLITMHELKHGILKPEQLKNIREYGGIKITVSLTTDAESVYKSLTGNDIKVPTEKTPDGTCVMDP